MSCTDVNRRIPLERWDRDAIAAPDDIVATNMLRFACFVDRVDTFDSGVFRLASAEATALDPQSRVLLEHTLASLQVCICCAMWALPLGSPNPALPAPVLLTQSTACRKPALIGGCRTRLWVARLKGASRSNAGDSQTELTAGRQAQPGWHLREQHGRVHGQRVAGVPSAAGCPARA